MKQQKMYEPEDKMISLIRDNYNLLQSLGSFGISLGFGDKTVSQVCEEQHVDTYTFLAVVNFTINGYRDFDDASRLSMPTLLQYLKEVMPIILTSSCRLYARNLPKRSTKMTIWHVS